MRSEAEAMRRAARGCGGRSRAGEVGPIRARWPVVHKVKADAKRTFMVSDEERAKLLEEVPGLRAG